MAVLNAISVSQLSRLIGTPAAPVIVDVCIDPDFDADPRLIPGALRHAHTDLPGLRARLGGRAAVIACQKGLKLSQGVVAWLRADGTPAEYLDGGKRAWAAAGAPMVNAAAIPVPPSDETLWVTRHRPRIDRIACPWLIRRFVDPRARVLFVSPAAVRDVADRFGATPFDVEDVAFSHRGALCSFDTMLDLFGLRDPALDRMATVIRGADTNRHDLAPQCAGLLALSVGLSRAYKDDQAQLGAGMVLYDALYRWAREGVDEGHDWPGLRG
ncbi:chromate resistance protein ChrB domain-containing protein [Actibacterium ureilyticum]|uniref:chromate resistance protein ChrB domain-containing protein n=1 Tax=Actibacterium ureilyticum TaxID=1590614 RepID=UPI000BAB1FAC|nr:sulfurtransferase/chromate resistance protein [Actibacterium ureilyticum]